MNRAFVTGEGSRWATRAAVLRSEFDRTFAEPAQLNMTSMEDLLAIRIGGDAFAIRLSEISGLDAGRRVTRMPGGDPALLGIAGFRGTIHPVYSIATLLERPAEGASRWLVKTAEGPIALAFDEFERHLRVAPEAIQSCDVNAKDRCYVQDFVSIQQFVRPILHLPSIVDAIRKRQQVVSPTEDS